MNVVVYLIGGLFITIVTLAVIFYAFDDTQ